MSLIVEYEHASKTFREALAAVPEMTLQHDQVYFTADDEVRWAVWASGGNFEAFDEALTGDPSVKRFRTTSRVGDKQLYIATLSGGHKDFAESTARELDIQLLDATITHETASIRARIPSREAFTKLMALTDQEYGRIRTRRLYREESAIGEEYNVTPLQREALLTALEAGYYEVPREASLEDVAARLGISSQASSARLRRGTASLLLDTLATREINLKR